MSVTVAGETNRARHRGLLDCSQSQRKQPTVLDATLLQSIIFFSFFPIWSPLLLFLVFITCHSHNLRKSQWMYVDISADLSCRAGFVSSLATCLPPWLVGGRSHDWVALSSILLRFTLWLTHLRWQQPLKSALLPVFNNIVYIFLCFHVFLLLLCILTLHRYIFFFPFGDFFFALYINLIAVNSVW